MKRPQTAAARIMKGYYASQNVTWPESDAKRLLDRICIRIGEHRWKHPGHALAADEILERSRFDADDLAENYLGIELSIESLRDLDASEGAPVFGRVDPSTKRVTICDRALEYEPLYRTTLMHEIGHVLLHPTQASRRMNYSPSSTRRPRYEREADEFMHCAILPESVLILAIAWLADFWGMPLTEALQGANTERGRYQWRKWYFPGLVNKLCVSRHLICLKLKHAGFFTQPTVDHHLSYAMANRWLDPSREQSPRRPFERILRDLLRELHVSNAG